MNIKGLKTSLKARLALLYFDSALSCWLCCVQTRDLCFHALLILNMTLWKDKSLVIIGCGLVLNNLFDEYSGSSYLCFLLWLNPPKVKKILFNLGESQKYKLLLRLKTCVALFRQRHILLAFRAVMILNMTLWKDKSLVITVCRLALNNLFDEYIFISGVGAHHRARFY